MTIVVDLGRKATKQTNKKNVVKVGPPQKKLIDPRKDSSQTDKLFMDNSINRLMQQMQ